MQRKENTKNKRFKGRKMKQTVNAKIENDRDGKCNKWKVQGITSVRENSRNDSFMEC